MKIKFGHIRISFPDESIAYFSIFEDLADFLGTEYQSEAFKILKTELKEVVLKPKPDLDYESDYTHITSKSADTIFSVVKIIHKLTLPDKRIAIDDEHLEEIYRQLKRWKRPPSQKWKIGDVFSIPLLDNTFSFGQVVGTHLTAKSPILALFEIKQKKSEVTVDNLKAARILSVWNANNTNLANYKYKVLFNTDIIVNPERVKDKNVSGGATMDRLTNVYFGLEPYNVMYKEDYYDKFFQLEIERPQHILWLNKEERTKYRREKLNIKE